MRLLLALLLLWPAVAHAAPPDDAMGDLTVVVQSGDDADVTGMRLYLGRAVGLSRDPGRWQPYASFGVHLGAGTIREDADHDAGRISLGFEARLGVIRVTSVPTVFFEVGVTPLVAMATGGADGFATPVPERGGAGGLRLSFAVGVPEQALQALFKPLGGSSGGGNVLFLLFMLPKTLELDMEVLDGPHGAVRRYGIGFGWSL